MAVATRPNPDMTFFQNYVNHARFGINDMKEECAIIYTTPGIDKKIERVNEVAYSHMNALVPLRDAYDYADEMVLTAAAGLALLLRGLIFTMTVSVAAFECLIGLTMQAGFMNDDGQDHVLRAAQTLGVGSALFVLSAAVFINSGISLISRPIATYLNGWAPEQEVNRFQEDEPVARFAR